MKRFAILGLYLHHVKRRPVEAIRYLLHERETSNFTYDISNREELCQFVAHVTGSSAEQVDRIFAELEEDLVFRDLLHNALRTRKDRHPFPRYGRRVVWYAIVRLAKPALVVETGVHDGLGSAVLLRALWRNQSEGAPGRLIGTDIDPTSGWLVPKELRRDYRLIVGDSLHTLSELSAPVDLFIHDSDHRYEYEMAEYMTVASKLEATGLLISDNAHSCKALQDYSHVVRRAYSYCREVSAGHFYPGGGVGISSPIDSVTE
jgi:predicted O-methyltransferase YrrM